MLEDNERWFDSLNADRFGELEDGSKRKEDYTQIRGMVFACRAERKFRRCCLVIGILYFLFMAYLMFIGQNALAGFVFDFWETPDASFAFFVGLAFGVLGLGGAILGMLGFSHYFYFNSNKPDLFAINYYRYSIELEEELAELKEEK